LCRIRDYELPVLGVNLEIGSPPQTVFFEVHTGSSEIWALGIPDVDTSEGYDSTFFNRGKSRSIKDLHKSAKFAYTNEVSNVNLYSDQLSLAGKRNEEPKNYHSLILPALGRPLGEATFGVAVLSRNELMRNIGMLGLLPPRDTQNTTYILDTLAEKGIIKERVFSLSLRDGNRGALTFAGYDVAKFSGRLEKMPTRGEL
jgi:hypothetical protein